MRVWRHSSLLSLPIQEVDADERFQYQPPTEHKLTLIILESSARRYAPHACCGRPIDCFPSSLPFNDGQPGNGPVADR